MTEPEPPPADPKSSAQALRQRAEARWQAIACKAATALGATAMTDIQDLVHELQVHQIELEMQNVELRRARDALDVSRARFEDLYDLAPVGYCSVSEAGLVVQTNLTLGTLLGVARGQLVKRPFSSFVLAMDQEPWYRLRTQRMQPGMRQTCELRMRQGVHGMVWVQLAATPALDGAGQPVLHVTVSDISASQQAKATLAESEMRWKFAIEGAGDGLWDWNVQSDAAVPMSASAYPSICL